MGGAGRWSLKEKYSFDLTVVDDNGVAISGATVVIKDANDVVLFTATTGVTGAITQQVLISKEFHFDPINNPSTGISENVYTTCNFTVSKDGYETYTCEGATIEKTDLIVSLKNVVPVRKTVDGRLLLANQPSKGSSSGLIEI
jgi:hypothetical protein